MPASWPATCFRAVLFAADGKPLPELDLHPLFQAYHSLCPSERSRTWGTRSRGRTYLLPPHRNIVPMRSRLPPG